MTNTQTTKARQQTVDMAAADTYRSLRLDIEAALSIPDEDTLRDQARREILEREAARFGELEIEYARDIVR